ncbi:MAG TPA: SRPBCC domain-containing protein [Sphingobium sp.]|nr:SRPBCC domain-containing protein [Sphingobium sp.]
MTDPIASALVIERTYTAELEELWELWTTKDGFESWWGPQEFRADVHLIEPRQGGALHYDMVADTPEAVAAMEGMGAPTTQPCHGRFTECRPLERLVLTQLIDFLPGVAPYDSTITVDFFDTTQGRVRMVVTLSQMHDLATTGMQREGFLSQLSKLDKRYDWQAA